MNAVEAHYLTNDYLVERSLYQDRDALLSFFPGMCTVYSQAHADKTTSERITKHLN